MSVSSDPSRWGPLYWVVIDTSIMTLPHVLKQKHQEDFYTFITSFQPFLPCPTCRNNFKKKMTEITPAMFQTRQDVIDFSVSLENNIRLHNKKEPIIDWAIKKKRIQLFQEQAQRIAQLLYNSKENFHKKKDTVDILLCISLLFLSAGVLIFFARYLFKKPTS